MISMRPADISMRRRLGRRSAATRGSPSPSLKQGVSYQIDTRSMCGDRCDEIGERMVLHSRSSDPEFRRPTQENKNL